MSSIVTPTVHELTNSAPAAVYTAESQQKRSHQCQWLECRTVFPSAEDLYHHITNEHIGRKSSGTLSLECHWHGCTARASKRDHLTSHVRVHVDLKPHSCRTCNKAFKRPQDLKKHEKIHTEEHRMSHRPSKANSTNSTKIGPNTRDDNGLFQSLPSLDAAVPLQQFIAQQQQLSAQIATLSALYQQQQQLQSTQLPPAAILNALNIMHQPGSVQAYFPFSGQQLQQQVQQQQQWAASLQQQQQQLFDTPPSDSASPAGDRKPSRDALQAAGAPSLSPTSPSSGDGGESDVKTPEKHVAGTKRSFDDVAESFLFNHIDAKRHNAATVGGELDELALFLQTDSSSRAPPAPTSTSISPEDPLSTLFADHTSTNTVNDLFMSLNDVFDDSHAYTEDANHTAPTPTAVSAHQPAHYAASATPSTHNANHGSFPSAGLYPTLHSPAYEDMPYATQSYPGQGQFLGQGQYSNPPPYPTPSYTHSQSQYAPYTQSPSQIPASEAATSARYPTLTPSESSTGSSAPTLVASDPKLPSYRYVERLHRAALVHTTPLQTSSHVFLKQAESSSRRILEDSDDDDGDASGDERQADTVRGNSGVREEPGEMLEENGSLVSVAPIPVPFAAQHSPPQNRTLVASPVPLYPDLKMRIAAGDERFVQPQRKDSAVSAASTEGGFSLSSARSSATSPGTTEMCASPAAMDKEDFEFFPTVHPTGGTAKKSHSVDALADSVRDLSYNRRGDRHLPKRSRTMDHGALAEVERQLTLSTHDANARRRETLKYLVLWYYDKFRLSIVSRVAQGFSVQHLAVPQYFPYYSVPASYYP